MKNYYKKEFNLCLKENKYHRGIKHLSPKAIDEVFMKYSKKFYGEVRVYGDGVTLKQLKEAFKTIILSNRYKKNEKFTKNQEFDLIRNITSKFSYGAFNKFFRIKVNQIIFKVFSSRIQAPDPEMSEAVSKCQSLISSIQESVNSD